MKFDLVFYEKLRDEVLASEDDYRRKYKHWFILGTLFWWSVLSFFLYTSFSDSGNPSYRVAFILGFFVPIVIYFNGKNSFTEKAERKIIEKIVLDNGGIFNDTFNIETEKAGIFRQGHKRKASNQISFSESNGRKVRFFQYNFTVGYGKESRIFTYHILGISGLPPVPHMYLNCKNNKYKISLGQQLSLPVEFERNFTLSIPEGYQLEALQIFTPDVMHAILNIPFQCDLEFVNGELLFIIEGIKGIFRDFFNMKNQIEQATKITDLLEPNIQKLRWSPVGDKVFRL